MKSDDRGSSGFGVGGEGIRVVAKSWPPYCDRSLRFWSSVLCPENYRSHNECQIGEPLVDSLPAPPKMPESSPKLPDIALTTRPVEGN